MMTITMLFCAEDCPRNTTRKSKGFQFFQQWWRLRCSYVCWMLPGRKLGRARANYSNNMMTVTMLVGLLKIAWEEAPGNNKGFHFFQQCDGDYDALRFVDYCLGKTFGKSKSCHFSSKMMTIAMLLCLLNIAWGEKSSWKQLGRSLLAAIWWLSRWS